MADFSGGSSGFLSDAASSGYYDSSSGPIDTTTQGGATGDLASLLGATYGGDMAGGPGPGQAGVGTDVSSGLGALIGDFFGGPIGGVAGAAGGAALYNYLTSPGAGGRRRGTHLNKSTYVTRKGGLNLVAKGTKQVANRRRNAGNAKAVRRALGRLAMFDNLARKVEGEMARVARRHHRPAARHTSGRRGHRPGCRCFACRR